MKILQKLSLFVLLLCLASCREDFVNIDNAGAISVGSYPNSVSDLEQLLTGVYATEHSSGLYGHQMLVKHTWMWDHTADLSWQGSPDWIGLSQNNAVSSYPFLQSTWNDTWRGVQRCNTLLDALESYRVKATATDMANIDLIKGQTHFLRAFFYFHLITTWGETFITDGKGGEKMGIPLITAASVSLAETQVSRASVKECWDFIISDLKTSETLLAGKTWTDPNEKHKVNIWAIKSFLAKVYVFTQDWTDAKTYLSDVIDNSGKSLVPFDVYKTMFNGQNEFNAESLYELNLNVDMIHQGGNDLSMGSAIGMVIAPTYVGATGGPAASAWSNVFPHAKNLTRFGFNLGHYFPAGTNTANIANVDRSYITRSIAARTAKTVDPRLWVACQQPYVDSMVVNGTKKLISHYLDITETDMEAWSFRKYTNITGTEAEVNMANGNNIIWLRMADMYLLYAETLIHTGNNTLALEYINKVHRRAYNLPVNTPSAVDYASLLAATKASDDLLKNDPLKYERWAELFGESSWWYDVCRWKIGAKEAAYYQKVRGGTIQWNDATDYAQPIPINELNANVNMKQNPGY